MFSQRSRKSPVLQPQVASRQYTRVQLLLIWLLGALVAGILTMTLVKTILDVPNAALPTLYAVGKGVAIYDRNNGYVCTVYADRDRKPVALTQISTNMRSALLAAEDHNFYNHHGVDIIGIGRAIVSNARAGHVVEGGSTITQQLVRNLYLDIEDRSIKRKLLEAFLAIDVENNYSKSKILETYLNEVYFGNGVYGIERASQVYFNKHASGLSLAESAFIAGLIKAPSDLGATMNRDAAITRQQEVLDKMVTYHLSDAAHVDQAKQEKLVFNVHPASTTTPYPYYVSTVLRVLERQMPQDKIWGKGLRVYTCLDQNAQKAAQDMLNKGINAAPHGINQGALVSQSVRDGSVIALVGGVGDYRNHQFNRALARHTVGSSFKPFVYLAALCNGALQPDSAVEDSPIAINMGYGHTYSPKNYDGRYLGLISARDALSLSRNVCAIRVADAVGIKHVIDTAKAAGITAPLDSNLTIALGSCAVSPLEMATAYGTLARYGQYKTPQLIRRVDDAQGQPIRSFAVSSSQTLPQEQVCELVDVLQDVVQHGTGTQAKLANIAVAGKTGTADKARDIWFVGFTPDTVTAVWGGNDRCMAVKGNVTGGMVMAKIWHDFMQQFYKTHPAPTGGFVPPRTPLSTQASSSINSSVLNDAQQYEEGVKEPQYDDATAPADQANAENQLPEPMTSQPQPMDEPQPVPAQGNTEPDQSREPQAVPQSEVHYLQKNESIAQPEGSRRNSPGSEPGTYRTYIRTTAAPAPGEKSEDESAPRQIHDRLPERTPERRAEPALEPSPAPTPAASHNQGAEGNSEAPLQPNQPLPDGNGN